MQIDTSSFFLNLLTMPSIYATVFRTDNNWHIDEGGLVMASYPISEERTRFPGKTDLEIALALSHEYGYLVIVRYKSTPPSDFDHFGCCSNDYQVKGYFDSPYCHDTEILYDGRKSASVTDLPTATSSGIFPDLVLIIYDNAPLYKEAFVQSLIKNLNIPVGPHTEVAAHQTHNAQTPETAVGFAVPLATRYLNQRSLDLQLDRTEYERFQSGSPLESIHGYLFRIYAKA